MADCKNGPFFSPTTYRELILPFHKQVVENITIPWIHHSDGNLMPVIVRRKRHSPAHLRGQDKW